MNYYKSLGLYIVLIIQMSIDNSRVACNIQRFQNFLQRQSQSARYDKKVAEASREIIKLYFYGDPRQIIKPHGEDNQTLERMQQQNKEKTEEQKRFVEDYCNSLWDGYRNYDSMIEEIEGGCSRFRRRNDLSPCDAKLKLREVNRHLQVLSKYLDILIQGKQIGEGEILEKAKIDFLRGVYQKEAQQLQLIMTPAEQKEVLNQIYDLEAYTTHRSTYLNVNWTQSQTRRSRKKKTEVTNKNK